MVTAEEVSSMAERERLLKRLATFDFAIIELHLFLDTHPNDEEIQHKLEDYNTKSSVLRREFEEKYGPIIARQQNGNNYGWIADPWPWDNSNNSPAPCCKLPSAQNKIQGE